MTNDASRPAPDVVEAGIPATTEMPPGVPPGDEDEEQPAPLDVPQGAEEWGVTPREQQLDEPLAARVLREQPDRMRADADTGARLVEPGEDIDMGLIDEEADEVAELDVEGNDMPGPEESALRIEEDPPGMTYDDSPGYLDDEE